LSWDIWQVLSGFMIEKRKSSDVILNAFFDICDHLGMFRRLFFIKRINEC